jgi:actin-like ATPase involved in cell morphogenesis
VKSAFEQSPLELGDIAERGLVLTGGGALRDQQTAGAGNRLTEGVAETADRVMAAAVCAEMMDRHTMDIVLGISAPELPVTGSPP